MARKVMITTIDNPYDPKTQFAEWFAFDTCKGYNSCGLLARFANTSDGLSDESNDLEIEKAINEIIKLNLDGGIYKKVVYSV